MSNSEISTKLGPWKKYSVPIGFVKPDLPTNLELKYYEIIRDINAPWVLITYQIHPDEGYALNETVNVLGDIFHEKGMPNILFVPESSPTGIAKLKTFNQYHEDYAIKMNQWIIEHPNEKFSEKQFFKEYPELRTLTNGVGNDFNWSITDNSDPEVRAWKKLLEGKKFEYSIHLHHDNKMFGRFFYGYFHSKKDKRQPINWSEFINRLMSVGFSPYAGHIDDEDKEGLNNMIPENGLLISHPHEDYRDNFENYLITTDHEGNEKVSVGTYTIELPNGLTPNVLKILIKEMMVGLLNRKTGYVQ